MSSYGMYTRPDSPERREALDQLRADLARALRCPVEKVAEIVSDDVFMAHSTDGWNESRYGGRQGRHAADGARPTQGPDGHAECAASAVRRGHAARAAGPRAGADAPGRRAVPWAAVCRSSVSARSARRR